MNPRLRRLCADYEQVQSVFAAHPRIHVVSTEGDPPEKYVVEYQVAGLVGPDELSDAPAAAQAQLTQRMAHRAEIFLPIDYPRRPPFCRMTTPIFHPNIDSQKICIGDHWSAGQRLTHLIIRIAEMITYQSYNVKSPLNGAAAAWASQNIERLPLEKIDLTEGL